MKEEDLIKKLKSLDLPSADLEDHRRRLRTALLASGSRPKPSRAGALEPTVSRIRMRVDALAAHLKSPQRVHRLAALGIAAFTLIIGLLVVTPFLDSRSPTAQAAEIARSSPLVKEALGGEDGRVVTVIKEGATVAVILEPSGSAPGSGNRVLATVDMNTKGVTSTVVGDGGSSQGTAGSTSTVLVSKLTADGADTVFLDAEGGLQAVCGGKLLWSAPFAGQLESVIDDVTGDGGREVISSRGSSVRCYNGVNGEKVWQFECGQRRVFEDGLGWGGVGLGVSGVEVLRSGASQILCVGSGSYVFGTDAQSGEQLWRFEVSDSVRTMAIVPGRDGDGTDELLVGTWEGNLYLVNGSTGQEAWKRAIGKEWVESGDLRHGGIQGIAVSHDLGCQAVIGVGDGRVCLVDLGNGDIGWENQVTYPEMRNTIQVWLVPDVTGDGLPEVLVNRGYVRAAVETSTSPDGVTSTRMRLREVVLLSGADGSDVWTGEMYTAGSAITSINGQPVALELHPQSGIRIVSLKDGQAVTSLTVPALGGKASGIEPMSDGGYLVSTEDGGLASISPAGELRWNYSRLSHTEVKTGKFTPDSVPDLLVLGEVAGAEGVRQVSVVDGVTHKEIWCCDVAGADSAAAGGLSGVQVVDDLTGDGTQDVLAYGGSEVFRFSGADGALARFDVGESITHLRSMKLGAGAAGILVGTGGGLIIIDKDGGRLWESAYVDWSASDPGTVQVLNDLNQDGISDLVLSFADRVLVAKSAGSSPFGFEGYRSFTAGDNKVIDLKDLTNDTDGDGVQEISYYEYDKDESAASGVLVVVSPVSGQVRHQWTMPVTVNLACADFNGDGCRDSLVYHLGPKARMTMWESQDFAQTKLEICSGKDGAVLWSFTFDGDWWNAGSEKMPAAAAGDITGDGIEDLAVSSAATLEGTSMSFNGSTWLASCPHETHVWVYDVVNNSLVRQVVLPPAQKDSRVATDEGHHQGSSESVSGPGDAMRLAGDINGDGHREMAVLAGYRPSGEHCLALVDLQNEQLLGYCSRLTTLDFFEAGSTPAVGFTDGSSVYLARMNSDLQVTWPSDGVTVGSHVKIAWEGVGDSSSASVFVDGYENARTTAGEVTLPLKPGEHEVIVRSVDEYGMVTYATVHFRVEQSPWASILAGVSVAALLLLYFAARGVRVMRNRRARREGL